MDPYPKTFKVKNPVSKKWMDKQKGDSFSLYEYMIEHLGSNGRDSVLDWLLESFDNKRCFTCGDYTIAEDGKTRVPKEVYLTDKEDFSTG